MSMLISPAKQENVTKICCPECGERLRGVGLLKDSTIKGLTFLCKRCKGLWRVETKTQ